MDGSSVTAGVDVDTLTKSAVKAMKNGDFDDVVLKECLFTETLAPLLKDAQLIFNGIARMYP